MLKAVYNALTRPRRADEKKLKAFFEAISAGDLPGVQGFVEKYGLAGYYSPWSDKNPPLNAAASKGRVNIVRYLLDKGADIDEKDGSGDTALADAARGGKTDVVALLLARGANPNIENDVRWMALHGAIGHRRPEAFRLLLDHGADVNARGNWGTTPLLHAVTSCQASMVVALLKKGADIHAATEQGDTALSISCHANRPRRVEQIIRAALKREEGTFHGGSRRAVVVRQPLRLQRG